MVFTHICFQYASRLKKSLTLALSSFLLLWTFYKIMKDDLMLKHQGQTNLASEWRLSIHQVDGCSQYKRPIRKVGAMSQAVLGGSHTWLQKRDIFIVYEADSWPHHCWVDLAGLQGSPGVFILNQFFGLLWIRNSQNTHLQIIEAETISTRFHQKVTKISWDHLSIYTLLNLR